MPQSMTGFASQALSVGGWNLSLECKSVNSRFLDLTLKLPDILKRAEHQLRSAIADQLVRGKVELSIRLERNDQSSQSMPNLQKLAELKKALDIIVEYLPESQPPSALEILMSQGIWMNDTVDSDAIVSECLSAMPNLIKELRDHRLAEGARLTSLLRDRCTRVQLIVAQYREQLPLLQAAQQKKLRERIHAFDVDCDEQRLEEELVFLANKSDVAEELDRLDAHVAAIGDALSGNEPCGRRLDFLMQELNREANTLGSKTTSLTTSNASVELKVLIEQMREQVQNLE